MFRKSFWREKWGILRGVIFTVAIFLAPIVRAQTVAVTANLKDLGGGNATAPTTYLQFTLQNYGVSIPTVAGSSVFVNPTPPVLQPNSSGLVTGTITPNDLINPPGTYYQVCVFFQGGAQWCNNFLITQATNPWNLNTALPLLSPPLPSGYIAYPRTFVFEQSPAATTWTINHNFGSQSVVVDCYNSGGQLMIPDTVTETSVNTVTVTFVTAQAGSCVVLNAGNVSLTNQPANAVITNPSGDQNIIGFNLEHNGATIPDIGHPWTWPALQTFAGGIIADSINGTQRCETFSGATADVQIKACLAAVSSGGIADATGLGATTQSICSTVTVGAGQTLKLNPATTFQPCSSAIFGMFSISPGGSMDGLLANVTSQAPFVGTVIVFPGNYRDSTHTSISHITCVDTGTTGSTGGACITMAASSLSSQSIAFVNVSDIHVYGMYAGISLSTSGSGFVNGNFFSNIEVSYSKFGYVFNATGGGISGNLFSNVSYQCCDQDAGSPTSVGIIAEGGAPINDNVFSGLSLWDTESANNATPILISNFSATTNLFVGHIDGTVSDSTNTNNIINLTQHSFFLPALTATFGTGKFTSLSDSALSTGCVNNTSGVFGSTGAACTATAIQAVNTFTLSGNASTTGNTPATIFSQTVTMPSSGCPCRVMVAYDLYWEGSAINQVAAAWVNDGTNSFASASRQNGTNSSTFSDIGASSISTTAGYANGATPTFNVLFESSSNATVVKTDGTGFAPQASWFQVTVMPSVN